MSVFKQFPWDFSWKKMHKRSWKALCKAFNGLLLICKWIYVWSIWSSSGPELPNVFTSNKNLIILSIVTWKYREYFFVLHIFSGSSQYIL